MGLVYTVLYHPLVLKKDIPSIDQASKIRIRKAIEAKLMGKPALFGIPLRQSLKGYRKLRVGDYRIVFRIKGTTIIILAILHRSLVYQVAQKRNV